MQLDCTAALMRTQLDLGACVDARPAYRLQHVISFFHQIRVILSGRLCRVPQESHVSLLGKVLCFSFLFADSQVCTVLTSSLHEKFSWQSACQLLQQSAGLIGALGCCRKA